VVVEGSLPTFLILRRHSAWTRPDARLGGSDMNSVFVIHPYKYYGGWVFDDPAVGLVREAFVAGADDVIERLAYVGSNGQEPGACGQRFPPGVEFCSRWGEAIGCSETLRVEKLL
jgi:hypothetical protein